MNTSQTSPSSSALHKQKLLLRKDIRAQRRKLSPLQQKKASIHLIRNLKRCSLFLRSKHIALYLGNDGEICPERLINLIESWGKKAYLPVIHPLKPQELVFCQTTKSTRYIKNRFGIREPEFKSSKHIKACRLSTVLMPLVAFDENGNRMGMGGGFYDRAFHYKHHSPKSMPYLVGLAHELQKQNTLPINDWDVPLDAIVTDRKIYL